MMSLRIELMTVRAYSAALFCRAYRPGTYAAKNWPPTFPALKPRNIGASFWRGLADIEALHCFHRYVVMSIDDECRPMHTHHLGIRHLPGLRVDGTHRHRRQKRESHTHYCRMTSRSMAGTVYLTPNSCCMTFKFFAACAANGPFTAAACLENFTASAICALFLLACAIL